MEEVEFILGEGEDFGLNAISLVDKPATGEELLMLAEHKPIFLAKDPDKQLLIGALLRPEQRIYRRRADGSEFMMFVTQETIDQLTKKFMRDSNQNEFTLQHEENLINLSVQEIWMVGDPKIDKSALYGFEYEVGTLMAITHVRDKKQWDIIKQSDIKGYSVEMLLKPKEVQLSIVESIEQILKSDNIK